MTSTPSQPPTAAPTGSPTGGGDSVGTAAEIEALQAALDGEHAAVYGYGVIGALLDGDDEATARDALAAHASRRDELRDLVIDSGATPVVARAAYRLPFEVSDAESARRLAAELEGRLTEVYADLIATTTSGDLREAAANSLIETERRAVRWSGELSAFPGLDARAGAPTVD